MRLVLVLVSVSIVTIAILSHQYRDSPMVKRGFFESSLLLTKWTQKEWWNLITPYNIVLGGIPLKNEGHHNGIRETGVDSILSMVETFEHNSGFWDEPMTLEEWEKMGMRVKHVEAVDFTALEQKHFVEGVAFLEKELSEGRRVYVHCKAGRGRSASIVIAYIMKRDGKSFTEALELVTSQRPQININYYQKVAILSYIESLIN